MKKKTSVCVTPELFAELRRLNREYNVSMSAMMEQGTWREIRRRRKLGWI